MNCEGMSTNNGIFHYELMTEGFLPILANMMLTVDFCFLVFAVFNWVFAFSHLNCS